MRTDPQTLFKSRMWRADRCPSITGEYAIAEKILGFECTIGVENIDNIIALVTQSGGKLVMPKTAIPHVGWIAKFLDTEGNLVCAMESDHKAS